MPSPKSTYPLPHGATGHAVKEEQIEYGFIGKLQGLKYEYRADIRDRAALERNFREKFEALNRVHLTDGEFARLLDEIITPDVFTAAKTLRGINAFTREDGAPLNYTLVKQLDEQHRIADCLISLDCIITAATQELKNLKTYKKGLMQQLFPSAEAGAAA